MVPASATRAQARTVTSLPASADLVAVPSTLCPGCADVFRPAKETPASSPLGPLSVAPRSKNNTLPSSSTSSATPSASVSAGCTVHRNLSERAVPLVAPSRTKFKSAISLPMRTGTVIPDLIAEVSHVTSRSQVTVTSMSSPDP